MEKTPAAYAVDWSIELDRGLRSKIPGKPNKAISEIGHRLEWWNREPKVTKAEFNMLGLIPGEDKLFANAILLRLADAFVSRDKHIKLCIVKAFLTELRPRKGKIDFTSIESKRVFSKREVDNHLEVLRRVKIAFDTGDVEVRALALMLFGCWAAFSKDSAEVRYLILSSIVSSHILEVKASLFAAGCFCELSDDFASVLLEILANMLSSSEVPVACRVAGAHAFAKTGWSSSLARRAYKKGLQLLLDSTEDNFLVAMLISLSKVSLRSGILVSGQVDLLFSFLSHDRTLRLQAAALSCLQYILAREFCEFSPSIDVVTSMFNFLHQDLPPALLSKGLQVLHKILVYDLQRFSPSDMLHFFTKLLVIVEMLMQSPIISNRLLAVRILADISRKFMRKPGMASDRAGTTLVSRAIVIIMDRINSLCKSMYHVHQPGTDMDQEVWNLLKPFLILLNECPPLEDFVLDKIYLWFEYLVDKDDGVLSTKVSDINVNKLIELGKDKKASILSKLMVRMSRLLICCLGNLDKGGALASQVHRVKLSVEMIHRSNLFSSYVHVVYLLLLHTHITRYCKLKEICENNNEDMNSNAFNYGYMIQNEVLALESSKKILEEKDNWCAYMAGKYAACQGAWFTAAFTFGQLIAMVQSDSFYRWLKSLSLFAYSEMKVQSLNLPEERELLFNWFDVNKLPALIVGDNLDETLKSCDCRINPCDYVGNLVRACRSLHSAAEILVSSAGPSRLHFFQIWFLTLRANVLQTVVDMLKLLDTVSFINNDKISKGAEVGNVRSRGCFKQATSLIDPLTKIATRLMKLTQEYDLIATSFIGMDMKSTLIVSALALNCSSLAFTTGFAVYFIQILSQEHFTNQNKKFGDSLHAMLIRDLIVRLQRIDRDSCRQLRLLLRYFGQPRSCSISSSSTKKLESTHEVRCIIEVCIYAITRVVNLRNEANKLRDEERLFQVITDGLKLLLNVVTKWINVPVLTPNYFFRVRNCVSCQLFAFNRDLGNSDGICILQGMHLNLDLCFQLNDLTPDLQFKPDKLYCILLCNTSFQLNSSSRDSQKKTQLDSRDCVADEIIDLNEKLKRYVSEVVKISNSNDLDYTCDSRIAEACVCFEPNEKGQGFSTCLLDVSAFPPGSYCIKWQGGCLDREGTYWSLPSLNAGPVFTIEKPSMASDSRSMTWERGGIP